MLLETTSHQVVKVHGHSSVGHHQLQLLIHFSDDIFRSFECVSNSAAKHVWSNILLIVVSLISNRLDHLDVQLKFAGAVFIFPDFD